MTAAHFTSAERRVTLAALMVVLMLSALDQTVVGTAMPRIIEQLHGLKLITWVSTAYMLTSTILVPIYGKLSDLYGRKPILITGVVIFVFGSMLCGLSGEFGTLPILGGGMVQLIVFRAIQGIGGAALFTSTFTIIADLFPPRERGKIMGLFGAVFSIAMVLGPLVGGFLTDHATVSLFGREIAGWRWVFYVNFPLGVLALFMIVAKMPALSHSATGRVDYVGAILLIAAFVPFLLGLTWAGNSYAWASPQIIGLFCVSAAALAGFLYAEFGNPDAIIPLDLFKMPVFAIANIASSLLGMALLGLVMFLPLFMQVVLGANATKSGWAMLPLMLGLMGSSILSGFLASKTGRYKPFILAGGFVLVAGTVLLSRIGPQTTISELNWRMLLIGIGLGPSQSLFALAIQNAVSPTQIGVATSSSQFFRQIGSTIGVAVFGALLVNNLTVELPKHVPQIPGVALQKIDLGVAQAQAMSPGRTHAQIVRLFAEREQTIARAAGGDIAARATVVNDPLIPDDIKKQFGAAAGPATTIDLSQIKKAMTDQAEELAAQIDRGTKDAFSAAITGMFGTSLAIVLIGLVATFFLPELPLQARMQGKSGDLQTAE